LIFDALLDDLPALIAGHRDRLAGFLAEHIRRCLGDVHGNLQLVSVILNSYLIVTRTYRGVSYF
jgi:hypothetical protein